MTTTLRYNAANPHMYIREGKDTLDEVIVKGAVNVHAEVMGDEQVCIIVTGDGGNETRIWVTIRSRTVIKSEPSMGYTAGKRKRIIEMHVWE